MNSDQIENEQLKTVCCEEKIWISRYEIKSNFQTSGQSLRTSFFVVDHIWNEWNRQCNISLKTSTIENSIFLRTIKQKPLKCKRIAVFSFFSAKLNVTTTVYENSNKQEKVVREKRKNWRLFLVWNAISRKLTSNTTQKQKVDDERSKWIEARWKPTDKLTTKQNNWKGKINKNQNN